MMTLRFNILLMLLLAVVHPVQAVPVRCMQTQRTCSLTAFFELINKNRLEQALVIAKNYRITDINVMHEGGHRYKTTLVHMLKKKQGQNKQLIEELVFLLKKAK